ncbi:CdiA C-terminal domain-containing protein [Thermoleptolyngbya sp.]
MSPSQVRKAAPFVETAHIPHNKSNEELRQISQRFAPAPPARTERTGAGRRAFIRQRREVFENPEAGYQSTFFDRASGGYVWVHENHNQGDSYQSELFVAKQLAKEGAEVKLLSERAEPGIPTPDADVDGVVFDFKRLTSAARDLGKVIQRDVREARRQGARAIAFHFDKASYDAAAINRSIARAFKAIDTRITQIIFVVKEREPIRITREEWENRRRL